MHTYTAVLFIHLLGVVTFFIALAFMLRAGSGLRRAATVEQVRLWSMLVRTTTVIFPVSGLVILGSGLYMASDLWTFRTPWIVVGIVSVVVIGALGGGVVDRRFAAIGQAAAAAADGPVPADLARLLADSVVWPALAATSGIGVGMLWLMATKPGWGESVAVVVGLALVGALIGFAVARPKARQPAAGR